MGPDAAAMFRLQLLSREICFVMSKIRMHLTSVEGGFYVGSYQTTRTPSTGGHNAWDGREKIPTDRSGVRDIDWTLVWSVTPDRLAIPHFRSATQHTLVSS
jgi:hypothetical protein